METTRDPERFKRSARRALDAGKPIVALTAGRTPVTQQLAVSHTGAIVGDQKVSSAALEELGIISVKSMEEFLTTLALISNHGVMPGRRVAYLSVSGGICEMFADSAIEAGLQMPPFHPETTRRLREILPAFSTPRNPLDVTGVGQTDLTLIPSALEILIDDENLDVIVFNDYVLAATAPTVDVDAAVEASAALGKVIQSSTKPVLSAGMTWVDPAPEYAQVVARSGKGFEIGGAAQGVLAIERTVWWKETRDKYLLRRASRDAAPAIGPPAAKREDGTKVWTETRSLALLTSWGVPTVPWKLCRTENDVDAAIIEFGFPLVAKVSSPDIAHKSRVGGVVLDIRDRADALAAFDQVRLAPRNTHPPARIVGALVTPMRTGGLDLIVGVKQDDTWGPVLVIGVGGVWTELLQDVAIALLPTSIDVIKDALGRLRGAALLEGGHGITPVDKDALADVVLRIAQLGVSLGPELESLEINPLRVDGSTIEALDGLVSWF